jgi:hypothetical protein
MSQNNSRRIITEDKVFILFPQDEFNRLSEIQQQILDHLTGNQSKLPGVGDFISREEAEQILGRKNTTLWKLRKQGKIKAAKVGSEVFYSRQSIIDYLNENLQ